MRRLFKGFLAAAVLVTGRAAFAPAPAMAQNLTVQIGAGGVQLVQERHRGDRRWEERRGDRRWDNRRHDRRWDDRRGDRRWDDRRGGRGPHAGRISRESVARCAQRYRSYDPRTHTFVVNNRGDRAVCRL